MVPVSFSGNQVPSTVMKWSHKFKVTKKDMYLSYDDLADVEENITEPKRKGKQKLFNS